MASPCAAVFGGPAHRRGVCFFLRSGSWGSSSVGRTNQRLLYVYTGQVGVANFVHLLANHMFVCYARALVGGEVEVFRVCVFGWLGRHAVPGRRECSPGCGSHQLVASFVCGHSKCLCSSACLYRRMPVYRVGVGSYVRRECRSIPRCAASPFSKLVIVECVVCIFEA